MPADNPLHINFTRRLALALTRHLPRGRARLADIILGGLKGQVEVHAGDFSWQLDIADRVQRLMIAGVYEPELTSFLRTKLSPGDTVLDIGAHIGWYAAGFLNAVGASGKVLAFEPRPDHFARLSNLAENAARDGYTLKPFNNGLSDNAGEIELHCGDANSGFNTIVGEFTRPGLTPSSLSIKVERLDDVLAREDVDRVALAKIDVEGAEYGVLQGAGDFLRPDRIRQLYVELSPQAAEAQGLARDTVATLLREAGYDGQRFERGQLFPIVEDDFRRWTFDSWWTSPA